MKICTSCAGTEADGATFGPKVRGRSTVCLSCEREVRNKAARLQYSSLKIRTRASYRAALRHRQKQQQMDWVDLVVRAP